MKTALLVVVAFIAGYQIGAYRVLLVMKDMSKDVRRYFRRETRRQKDADFEAFLDYIQSTPISELIDIRKL